MTQWQINPGAVEPVLVNAGEQSGELFSVLTEDMFTGILTGLDSGGAATAAVPAAVSSLLADQQQNLQSVVNRVNAGILGVMNATIAYNQGQYDMATTFNSQMHSAASSGDFSYFEQHGYQGE